MSLHTVADPVDWVPQRIAVAGTSGVGKTTLANRAAAVLGLPCQEIDALHWGEDWTPRSRFIDEVDSFTAGDQWVIELQYRAVRPMIVQRADTVVWLDYSSPVAMGRLLRRTITRRLRHTPLWNGNVEPPLATFFTDKDHIVRWGWRTRHQLRPVIPTFQERFPDLHVVHLKTPRQAEQWLTDLSSSSSKSRK